MHRTSTGISDRGTVREQAWADVVVFDPATIAERGTLHQPNQYATGVHHVLVKVAHGQSTRHEALVTSLSVTFSAIGLIPWRAGRQFTWVEVKARGKRLPACASDYYYADVFISLNGIQYLA